MKVEISQRADSDLESIYRYSLRLFGEARAETYYWSLWNCFDVLAANPKAAPERPDLNRPVRCHHHRKHLIFYDVREDHILIVRVLHESMNVARHLP